MRTLKRAACKTMRSSRERETRKSDTNEGPFYSQGDIVDHLRRCAELGISCVEFCERIGISNREAAALLLGGEDGRLAYAAWLIRMAGFTVS